MQGKQCPLTWYSGSSEAIHIAIIQECLHARGGAAGIRRTRSTLRREQLARFKVTSTPSSLRRWQDRGSRLMPGPATRTSQVCCLLPVFRSVTRRVRGVGPPTVSRLDTARCRLQVCCLWPVFHSITHPVSLGRGVGPPTLSRHEVSTVQVCCLRPVFPIRHSPGRGVGPPTL